LRDPGTERKRRRPGNGLRLAHQPGTGARFWLSLSTRCDPAVIERDHGAASRQSSTPAA
jgi:hypothetical protein